MYDALRELAQGFLDFPGNRFDAATLTDETLTAIYDNSLIVLYRMLFALYAESRDLLPLQSNGAYRSGYSFDALKRKVVRDMQENIGAVATRSRLWDRLVDLWDIIDKGDAALDVPTYNGGLFKPEGHPFLMQYRVGDAALRQAIDLLARVANPETGRREFVDYRDLDVRHLGSIYEGLLEYWLRIANDALTVETVGSKSKKTERYKPAGKGDAIVVAQGGAYLMTDNGERKQTGSYYTPDYIVQYIVEQTLRPLLDASSDSGKVGPAAAPSASPPENTKAPSS